MKIHIGSGPMAETMEKVIAELILKASIARAKRLKRAPNLELLVTKK